MSKTSPKVDKTATPKFLFITMGLDMSWRLIVSVLLPIFVGAEVDKALHTTPLFIFIGLALAVAATVVVIRRTVRVANEHPALNPSKKDEAND